MTRAMSGTVKRMERGKKAKPGRLSHAEYVAILREIELKSPFRPYKEAMPAPPPTVIDLPVLVAPPQPEPPPEPIGGQPTEFPEPIREVTWRLRGAQDWSDDSENMIGRCLTDYDPLEDE